MKKSNIFNIILTGLLVILILLAIGMTVYLKIEENKQNQSIKDVYNSITYNEKLNVYLFYGDGCPHCANEEAFFESISSEYGDKYNLYKIETWYNKGAKILKKKVVDKLNEEGLLVITETSPLDSYYEAVPLVVIGKVSYLGYSESIGESILTAILEQEENEYDVMKKLDIK